MGLTLRKGSIEDLQKKTASLISPEVRLMITKRMGLTATKLVADGFKTATDPEGKQWAPVQRLRKKDIKAKNRQTKKFGVARPDKPLQDTGRLRTAATAPSSVLATPSGFVLHANVTYASFHQDGSKRTKRRSFYPGGGDSDLPDKWRARLEKDAKNVLKAEAKK